MIARDDLQPLVAAWLPTQRWFAGKGRHCDVRVAPLAAFGAEDADSHRVPIEIWVATVTYDDQTSEMYQLPLISRPEPAESLEHVLLGSVGAEGSTRWIYDALHDREVTGAWLDGVRQAGEPTTPDSGVRFTRYVEADEIPADASSLVLTGEQSNTSLIYGDQAILKVFRRLQAGTNPDIEVHAALGERGGRHIARLLGSMGAALGDEPCALAMLQEFMTTATDGWELAKTSVRDLMAEADLHAEEAGGDFAAEAHRLGVAIAETHGDLAEAFGTATARPDAMRAEAGAMRARLQRAVDVVRELDPLADALRGAFDDFEAASGQMTVQRIHGDLHLGQALRTVHRWVIIDFEGEPMATLDDRRVPMSPMRDVAGMLRSFEYAGQHRVIETGFDPQLNYRAAEWTQRNRGAFCDGYAEAAGHDPREQAVLLRAFEADKAVYEAVYEARNRPTWLPIPLASLNRLAEEVPQ